MTREGPALDRLTHRLSECPADFLAAPRRAGTDGVHVDAIVHDLVIDLGGPAPDPEVLAIYATAPADSGRHLSLVLVASWLLSDPWFREAGGLDPAVLAWLRHALPPLAALVSPELFVRDPDRREEFVRLCLTALGLRPAGETEAQAEDRLRTLDSVERVRLIRDTRKQQEQARKLAEAMKKKAAEEAAAKVTRE
jgi:hypothetical protein